MVKDARAKQITSKLNAQGDSVAKNRRFPHMTYWYRMLVFRGLGEDFTYETDAEHRVRLVKEGRYER